jgi:sulfur carrier protein
MNVILNGISREIETDMKLPTLIAQLALTGKRLAVELNGEILPRSRYEETGLVEGDRIEIVQAIGGG